MSKHSKKSSSLLHYPVLVVFSLFFVGLFALDLITPDRAYSEMENTTLSQRPALTQLSAKGLNSYFTAYTKYVKDQVFGRDQWISLQSVVETTLLQKEQNGGILLGKEHMMFPRTFGLLDSETRTLPKNTAAVESLCQRYPGKVNVLLAPAASDIYKENVPANAPLLDEDTYLDRLSAAVQAAGGRFVDVRQVLAAHKSEYIYYRTDHHWTTLGAYYAYGQLCAELGLTPAEQEQVVLREIGVTLLLPDSWKGRYEVVEDTFAPYGSAMWEFCVRSVYEAKTPIEGAGGSFYRGTLFTVLQCADYSMSAEEFAQGGLAGIGQYLFATQDATYAVLYAGDIQFDPTDAEQQQEWYSMAQTAKDIRFVLSDMLS